MNLRLKDRVAIITGSTSGIGRSSAVVFAQEGAKVVIVGRRRKEGEKTLAMVKDNGGDALYVQADVTREEDVDRMVAQTLSQFRKVDILFNNAGINPLEARTPLAECPEEAWDFIMEVNIKGIYRCSKNVVPLMIQNGGGVIINTSSTYGFVGFKDRAAYVASKGAVSQLTKAMAIDYGPHNIRVNCICPGMVLNERVQAFVERARKEGRLEPILADYPLGRLGTTEEVARVAAFLASDDASWITGAAIPVDGGYTAR